MTKNKLPKIIVIVGPTASGKTALSLEIARRFNGEVVSADSRQVYRGMDIGTAKPTKKEMAGIRHYLVNVKNPDEDYNVAQYKRDATRAIREIIKRRKTPILTGGTGLYVDAVIKNLRIPQVKANPELRNQLEKEIQERGLKFVFDRLIGLDPEAAYIVDPNNPRRIIRALEVAMFSGKPFSSQRKTGNPLFDFIIIGTKQSSDILKERIAKRVHEMMKNGLVEEVKKIVDKYGNNIKPLDAIGYREIIDFLKGKITLQESVDLMIKNTWHYARRQMTWFTQQHFWDKSGAGFKKTPRIKWLNPQNKLQKHRVVRILRQFLA